jgi:hypothetical protein
MRLYQQEFGLTELRVYTTAFMLWLALLFIWFALTVLRDHREAFAVGALGAAMTVLVGLHLINPDALIVRTNIANANAGHRQFDSVYALSLSADAVPALVAALPTLPAATQCSVARRLIQTWERNDDGWQNWSWSRARAYQAVNHHLILPDGCDPPVQPDSM